MNESNTSRVKNPFASFRVVSNAKGDKEENTWYRSKPSVRKVVLAPSKPAAVYKDDSKSAAVLSNFLRVGKVKAQRTTTTTAADSGERKSTTKKAVQVSLASLRRGSTRPFVDRSVLDELVNKVDDRGEKAEVGKCPPAPAVEEINLVSSDDENVESPPRRVSTGVAIFDDVSDGEGSEEEEYESDDDDGHGTPAALRCHGLPAMVMVNGSMQPWWRRLSDFVPISELSNGVDPRDGSHVCIDFASQFKGTTMPSPGQNKKKKKPSSSQSKGYWMSDESGEKCFVTPSGETLRGRAGYVAYTRSRKSLSSSAQRPRKRRKKAKRKSKK